MAQEKAHHYREQAAQLRLLADREDDPDLKADILWLAEEYDKRLAACRQPSPSH